MTLSALVVDFGGVLDDFGELSSGRAAGSDAETAPVVRAVEWLRDRDVTVALLSNGDSRPTTIDCDRLFDVVAVSAETGFRKPAAASFRHVLGQLGVSAERCVIVDDEARNVAAAVEMGMVGIVHSDVESTLHELSVLFESELSEQSR
ncbi:haloacid dehalogenase superfamily, subfamily IA, variant 3 with third motif having DD or ED/haloacid dehalogenase superfamily, subfamily IA, variant 1 with third motif having Dx(3-4)D or Dx(3-4)E [Actinopolyspora mzabensis]|uniref:Haloacid dehalogenase superfamily, subfamily IA, variant 3 with third motif having DD or ED/haloacid dehalogenase superfamily, subfamily IA, variant 1 with third motif having Dx(3-4)D or Dx(3-4)E n=1 Tax=Actinopolyspora mzabensis TaxID=995066 RepID=A0A1G9D529_ACTMZ|nr:HAD-IA family hydrolase [Actinopolyspora mzabensis]SDK59022.1 haloacid dehalogenase superfamily, subfamily IA, variant 3 with third motif having DD or ED/haloacid dehalogenase superfamily, subfamily IA, variant 1 with third motif having Dx(3-4)D or Dx(3-4)E [Actinopolyspora mzabensis]